MHYKCFLLYISIDMVDSPHPRERSPLTQAALCWQLPRKLCPPPPPQPSPMDYSSASQEPGLNLNSIIDHLLQDPE